MSKRLLLALMTMVMLAPTAVHAEDMEIHESAYANPEVNKDITEDGPQSPADFNISEVSNGRKPASAVAGILGTAAVAIGGLLGLRFLSKRKTNASKTSDLVLLLEPSSPQLKEKDSTAGSEQPPKREDDHSNSKGEPSSGSEKAEDHTHSSNPLPKPDPPSQESVVTSSGNQRPASSHDSGLPPGSERIEKVIKFLAEGFYSPAEVVNFLIFVREELGWTSLLLSQLIHACSPRSFVTLTGTYMGFPQYIEEIGPNMLYEGRSLKRLRVFKTLLLSKENWTSDTETVVYEILSSLDTRKKRNVFLYYLHREHKAGDFDFDPISLEPLP